MIIKFRNVDHYHTHYGTKVTNCLVAYHTYVYVQ
jgi:hypothetical protein